MAKLAVVATIKLVPGRRDEYLPHLVAHGKRCLETEAGTLRFDIMLPNDDPDAIMLYEVYESPAALTVHFNGPSMQQARKDTAGMSLGMTAIKSALVE